MCEEVTTKKLKEMKSQMALRSNWKEVSRLNKALSMRGVEQINHKITPNHWLCK